MSKPKHLNAYPQWLVAVLSEFEADAKRRTLTFDTPAQARAFQLDLSGFKGAIYNEGAEDTWPRVLCIRTKIEDGCVTLYHADEIPTPKIEVK